MVAKKDIDCFFSEGKIALAGISNKKTKFGNSLFKTLVQKAYEIIPVHPKILEYEGLMCYQNLKSLPEDVKSLLVCVKPDSAFELLKESKSAGIKNVWLQPGAQSDEAIEFADKNGINLIHGHCILMYAEPVKGIHNFHKGLSKLFGKYAK